MNEDFNKKVNEMLNFLNDLKKECYNNIKDLKIDDDSVKKFQQIDNVFNRMLDDIKTKQDLINQVEEIVTKLYADLKENFLPEAADAIVSLLVCEHINNLDKTGFLKFKIYVESLLNFHMEYKSGKL